MRFGAASIDKNINAMRKTNNVELLKELITDRLDEAGLTTAEFRVYCHISSRGVCFEKLQTMTAICKINEHTARKSIKSLLEKRMIVCNVRPGRTTEYKVLPVHCWEPLTKQATTPLIKRATSSRYKPSNAKCIPSEVHTKKVDPSVGKFPTAYLSHSLEKSDSAVSLSREAVESIAESSNLDVVLVEEKMKKLDEGGWVDGDNRKIKHPEIYLRRLCMKIQGDCERKFEAQRLSLPR